MMQVQCDIGELDDATVVLYRRPEWLACLKNTP